MTTTDGAEAPPRLGNAHTVKSWLKAIALTGTTSSVSERTLARSAA